MSASRSRLCSRIARACGGRAAAIALDIDPLPPVLDCKTAKAARRRSSSRDRKLRLRFTASKGNAAEAFRNAAFHVQRGQFRVQRMTALPMETRGLLAEWDEAAGRLTISGAAKLPFFNKRAMAAMMKLSEDAVDMIEIRCRRRLRRARRVLSRGLPRRLRGAPLRPPRQMDRGPPRASGLHRTIRARPNATSNRPSTATARSSACAAQRCRYRRLCAPQRHDAGAQHRAIPVRALSRAQHPSRGALPMSATRRRRAPIAGRGGSRLFLHRAHAGDGRARDLKHRPRRDSAAAISIARDEMPYRLASVEPNDGFGVTHSTAATIPARSSAALPKPAGRKSQRSKAS